jgi:hypothetical protein
VHGFSSLYGGAGTELHHQILAWLKMKLRVPIIPTNAGYKGEALYQPLLAAGVTVHECDQFAAIKKDAPVLGFCNAEILGYMPGFDKRSEGKVGKAFRWVTTYTDFTTAARFRRRCPRREIGMSRTWRLSSTHWPMARRRSGCGSLPASGSSAFRCSGFHPQLRKTWRAARFSRPACRSWRPAGG